MKNGSLFQKNGLLLGYPQFSHIPKWDIDQQYSKNTWMRIDIIIHLYIQLYTYIHSIAVSAKTDGPSLPALNSHNTYGTSGPAKSAGSVPLETKVTDPSLRVLRKGRHQFLRQRFRLVLCNFDLEGLAPAHCRDYRIFRIYIYIYTCMYTYPYVHMYVYIYIHIWR